MIKNTDISKERPLQGVLCKHLGSRHHVHLGLEDGVKPDIDEYGVGRRERVCDASNLVTVAQISIVCRRAGLGVQAHAGGMVRPDMSVALIESVKTHK